MPVDPFSAPVVGDPAPSDNTQSTDDPAPQDTSEPEVVSVSLEIPKELAGTLPEKFKGDPAKFVRSYIELEKKLGQRPKPPEEYKFEDAPVPVPEELHSVFRAQGLTQEQAEALVKSLGEYVLPELEKQQIAAEQQRLAKILDKPVDEAVARAKFLIEWAKDQPDGEELVELHSKTASGVLYLNQLYEQRNSDPTAMPGDKDPKGDFTGKILTEEQVQELILDPRYDSDPVFRQQADRRIEASIQAELALAKPF
ncbi:MAG: hypothetical protein D6816_17005 [Bacteroidetes bacterium]|nr:MAG: hypothetical protein D6816_17005 [Bacteroidota bacterium]